MRDRAVLAATTLGAENKMSEPVELFYSYSHEDEEYRKKLGEHLSVLRRAGLITDWHDRTSMPDRRGRKRSTVICSRPTSFWLLVSASFIASDYCWGDEMTKALARHKDGKARVIPIILHPCGWLRTPLQALQGVPRDNKAISLWSNEHAAFDHVVSKIAKVVDDLRRSRRTTVPRACGAGQRRRSRRFAAISPSPRPSPARGRGR
jgi:TIR domain